MDHVVDHVINILDRKKRLLPPGLERPQGNPAHPKCHPGAPPGSVDAVILARWVIMTAGPQAGPAQGLLTPKNQYPLSLSTVKGADGQVVKTHLCLSLQINCCESQISI